MNQKTILIVEDEGLIALHLVEMLSSEGYAVPDPIASGEELFEYLESSPLPDIILMDVGLGRKMNGIEAARQVKARYSVPVIFLTAYSEQRRVEEMNRISPNGYLMKPALRQDLVGAIEKALISRL